MSHFHTPACVAILTLIASFTPVAAADSCAGDIVQDNRVDGGDLGTLLANWGPVTATAISRACDIDGDGVVSGSDLGLLLANWRQCAGVSWATTIEATPNPALVTDANFRAAIVATGLPWRVRDNGTGMEMVLIPPGTFDMGCVSDTASPPTCQWPEYPVHQVTLTSPFYLGRYEVTQAEFQAKMGWNPSWYRGYPDSDQRPVEGVTFSMAAWYLTNCGFRFPTEAEWEYACRAGTATVFSNGSNDVWSVGGIAWYGGDGTGHVETHPCGQKLPNAFGLFDMCGNVAEWVNDRWDLYSSGPQIDPSGPAEGISRVVRGGNFGSSASELRSSRRVWFGMSYSEATIGFRAARTP